MHYINSLRNNLVLLKPMNNICITICLSLIRHRCQSTYKIGVFVDEGHDSFPALYCLPKFHKIPYKSHCYARSVCTLLLSFFNTFDFFAILKDIVKRFMRKMLKFSLKLVFSNSGEIINKIKSTDCLEFEILSNMIFSPYTTLPHNLIQEKLTKQINHSK